MSVKQRAQTLHNFCISFLYVNSNYETLTRHFSLHARRSSPYAESEKLIR